MKCQVRPGIVAFLLLCTQISFSQVQQVRLNSAADMRGAYTMLKQTADTGTGAFVLPVQQMKIFTDKYVMYAHRRSDADSSADFGIGTYRLENGKVIEQMFFAASGAGNDTFELAIDKQKNGYSQVIHFPPSANGTRWLLTEDYATSSKKMTSPLDGAWSIKSRTLVDKNGKETTYNAGEDAKQFKLFESGYFMWASYQKSNDSGTISTAYGYGTFTLDNPNQITETNSSSTFANALVGKPVTLKLKFTGKDLYEQTQVGTDGSKQIEVYERLK